MDSGQDRTSTNATGAPGAPSGLSGPGGVLLAAALLSVAVVLAYSNTFHASFVFDDIPYIEENTVIRELGNFWPPSGTRYFTYLSFALNYHFGGLEVFGYHVVNTAIHIVNSVLVFIIVSLTLRTPAAAASTLARSGGAVPAGFALAIFTSALFALHPVQTESVTYLTQRFASLTAMFYLLSVALYAGWRLTSPRLSVRPLYVLAIVAAAVAQMTKEIAFTLPFAVILYELVFFSGANDGPGPRKRAGYLFPFLLLLAIIPVNLFFPHQPSGGEETIEEMVRRLQVTELETLSRYEYLVTQFRVLVTYLRLLVLPVGQNLDYDYPRYTSFFAPAVLASFAFLAAVFAGAVYTLARSVKSRALPGMLASFGVLWFFMTISIESSIIPIADVIFEHRLYLPSFGLFLAAGAGGAALWQRVVPGTRTVGFLLVITLVCSAVFGAATYKRNFVWQDQFTLYDDILRKSPEKPRVHYDLGNIYYKAGRLDEAIESYRLALALDPEYANALNMLGVAYRDLGMVERAVGPLAEAARLKPYRARFHNDVGYAYYLAGDIDHAIAALKEAIERRPAMSEAHNNLGLAYAAKGLMGEAIDEFTRAVGHKPENAAAHYNLADALAGAGRYGEAADHYRRFIETAPEHLRSYVPAARRAIEEMEALREKE